MSEKNLDIVVRDVLSDSRILQILVLTKDAQPGCEIVRELGTNPATTYYILRRLVEEGVIIKDRGLTKKRRYYILTEKGQSILAQTLKKIRQQLIKRRIQTPSQIIEAYLLEDLQNKLSIKNIDLIINALGLIKREIQTKDGKKITYLTEK